MRMQQVKRQISATTGDALASQERLLLLENRAELGAGCCFSQEMEGFGQNMEISLERRRRVERTLK